MSAINNIDYIVQESFHLFIFIYCIWVLEDVGGGEWEFGCLVWFPFNNYDDHNHIEYFILENYYMSLM